LSIILLESNVTTLRAEYMLCYLFIS